MAGNFYFQVICNPKPQNLGRCTENQIYLLKHAERDMKTKSDRSPPI